MKLVVTVLILFLVLNPNRANTTTEVQYSATPKRLALKTPMQTKSVLARVVPRPQRKFLATNVLLIDDTDDSPAGPNELDLQSPYRRPKLSQQEHVFESDNDKLSDYVIVRLAVARARAMQKYREIHAV